MATRPDDSLTSLLNAPASEASTDRLLTSLYGQLRRIAGDLLRAERPGHTLQPTALVHEAWGRMVDPAKLDQVDRAAARGRFLGLAARAMRRVLIDHARTRGREKRGGDMQRITLGTDLIAPAVDADDLLDVEAALVQLEESSPRLARIAEMRLFAGLGRREVADALGVSLTTVTDEWALARALLTEHLSE